MEGWKRKSGVSGKNSVRRIKFWLDQISGVSGKNSDGMNKFRIDQVTLTMSLRNPTTFRDILSRIERSISQTSKMCVTFTIQWNLRYPSLD